MKNKKTLKLLILLILSIIFNVFNIYVMNYNSDSVNYLLIHTLSRYMSPVPILFIGYLLCMILEPLIKEPLKKYLPLIFMFLNFNRYFLFSNKIFLKNEIKEIQKLIAKRNELILMNRSIRKYGFVPYSLLIDLNKENK